MGDEPDATREVSTETARKIIKAVQSVQKGKVTIVPVSDEKIDVIVEKRERMDR